MPLATLYFLSFTFLAGNIKCNKYLPFSLSCLSVTLSPVSLFFFHLSVSLCYFSFSLLSLLSLSLSLFSLSHLSFYLLTPCLYLTLSFSPLPHCLSPMSFCLTLLSETNQKILVHQYSNLRLTVVKMVTGTISFSSLLDFFLILFGCLLPLVVLDFNLLLLCKATWVSYVLACSIKYEKNTPGQQKIPKDLTSFARD